MDHDRLFKELLGTFFFDFLRLFVPELADQIEEASLVPLDKEVFTDVTAGSRHEVDLLVRARFKQASAFFLIHVETQAKPQPDFPGRMFRYFARLYERHDAPIYPIAVFSFDRPRREEPNALDMTVAGLEVLRFRFRVVQLNRLSWKDFREASNPVASALMARMRMDPEERGRVKWECYRLLATLKLDRAKSALIGGFVDAYLRLDEAQERVFREALAHATPQEREVIMELSNPWLRQGQQEGLERGRRMGMEEGLQEGRQEGRQVGLQEGRQVGLQEGRQVGLQEGRQAEAAKLVVRLLEKRLGALAPGRVEAVERLGLEALESLADAVFDIRSDADLAPWLG